MALSDTPRARMERYLTPRSNDDVMAAFVHTAREHVSGSRCSMSVRKSGKFRVLVDYATPVAFEDLNTGDMFVSMDSYSVTTSRHIQELRYVLADYGRCVDRLQVVDCPQEVNRGWNSGNTPFARVRPWRLAGLVDAREEPIWQERAWTIIPVTGSERYGWALHNHGRIVAYVFHHPEMLTTFHALASDTIPQYVQRAADALRYGQPMMSSRYALYRLADGRPIACRTSEDGVVSWAFPTDMARLAAIPSAITSLPFKAYERDTTGDALAMEYAPGKRARYYPDAWEDQDATHLYKVLDGLQAIHGGHHRYTVGEWQEWQRADICHTGYHVTTRPENWTVAYRDNGGIVWRVRVAGPGDSDGSDKRAHGSIMLTGEYCTMSEWLRWTSGTMPDSPFRQYAGEFDQ